MLVALAPLAAGAAGAQSIDDGLLVPRRMLRAGVEYRNDQWSEYWEGALRRSNANIGTLTTQSVVVSAGYGVTSRLSLFATLPYVRTRASDGVLQGMGGRQDLTLAAKYQLTRSRLAGRATLGTFVVAGAAAPTSDYTVDFLPMSIGLGSRRAMGRLAMHLQDPSGLFVDAAAGRAWRGNVHLDRPAYYTDGRLYSTNEVAMPDVADYALGVGYLRGRWCVPLSLGVQRTLGGGDMRRQDMPFVSNRMNVTVVQGHVMYILPSVPGALQLQLGGMQTLAGRNVGRSSTITAGFAHAFRL